MVIQLDIDGTLDRDPVFFRWLSGRLRADGHTVLVVTARIGHPSNRDRTIRQLVEWGVAHDELVMSPPYDDLDPSVCPDVQDWEHRRHLIKLVTARKRSVDVVYDDSPEVADLLAWHAPSVRVFRVMPQATAGESP